MKDVEIHQHSSVVFFGRFDEDDEEHVVEQVEDKVGVVGSNGAAEVMDLKSKCTVGLLINK